MKKNKCFFRSPCIADLGCTRRQKRDKIVAECNYVRQALQDLLTEFANNAEHPQKSHQIEAALDNMFDRSKDLKRILR